MRNLYTVKPLSWDVAPDSDDQVCETARGPAKLKQLKSGRWRARIAGGALDVTASEKQCRLAVELTHQAHIVPWLEAIASENK